MELPAGPVQEYIRLAGIAAIYVARLPSGTCRIGISRDLKRTMTALHRQGHDLTIVGAFWVDDTKMATRIASRVNKCLRHAGNALSQAEATTLITAAAADMKLHLTKHDDIMQRVESAVAHVKKTLEQAQRTGELQWFNRAFHDFRLRARTCGHPPMSYGQACARLRRVIVQRALAGEPADSGVSILPLVFPELSQ